MSFITNVDFSYFETVGPSEEKFHFAMNLKSDSSPFKLESDDMIEFTGTQGFLMAFEEPSTGTTNPKSCLPLDATDVNILTNTIPNLVSDSIFPSPTNKFEIGSVYSQISDGINAPLADNGIWTNEDQSTPLAEIPIPERGLMRQNT